MELRVLKYFVTAAEEQNLSRAAEKLHVTQPTLSRQLMNLEQELQVDLFDRSSHRLKLTTQGALLKRRAQEMLDLEGLAIQELKQESELAGEIRIGCGDISSFTPLARAIEAFFEQHPGVTFVLNTLNAGAALENLDRGLIDLALLLEPVKIENLDYLSMAGSNEWHVLMNAAHPLAASKKIRPHDLLGWPLILPGRGQVFSLISHWAGEYLDQYQIFGRTLLPNPGQVIVANSDVLAVTCSGSDALLNPDLFTLRPLDPEVASSSVLAWKRDIQQSALVKAFIQFIKENRMDDENKNQ